MLGPKKELWDLLQKVEKLDPEAADITASVRDLPTVRLGWEKSPEVEKLVLEAADIIASVRDLPTVRWR